MEISKLLEAKEKLARGASEIMDAGFLLGDLGKDEAQEEMLRIVQRLDEMNGRIRWRQAE